jgi:hypothetical protein
MKCREVKVFGPIFAPFAHRVDKLILITCMLLLRLCSSIENPCYTRFSDRDLQLAMALDSMQDHQHPIELQDYIYTYRCVSDSDIVYDKSGQVSIQGTIDVCLENVDDPLLFPGKQVAIAYLASHCSYLSCP